MVSREGHDPRAYEQMMRGVEEAELQEEVASLRLSKIELDPNEALKLTTQALQLEARLGEARHEFDLQEAQRARTAAERGEQARNGREDSRVAWLREQDKIVGEMPPEEAGRMLKAISTRATGTIEGSVYEAGAFMYNAQDVKDLPTIEGMRDPRYFNTYDANNGVVAWVDDRGDRLVTSDGSVVNELLRRAGLRHESAPVPHSNDGGEYILSHNPFLRELQLRQAKEDLRAGAYGSTREKEWCEKWIRELEEGEHTPANYQKMVAKRFAASRARLEDREATEMEGQDIEMVTKLFRREISAFLAR